MKRMWHDKRGNALILAGAALPLIVGSAGLATDTIQWTLWKRQLQRAADSAAIAGVYDRQTNSGSTTNTEAAVNHDLTLNNKTWMALKTGYPAISYPANSGSMQHQVDVTLGVQQPLAFSSMFMSTAPTIIVNSRAASIPSGGDACILALETGTTTGITFSGNTGIHMPDCDAFSNSAGTNSSVARGSAAVNANSVGGVGGIQESRNFTVQSYRPYSPALSDPFASVTPDPADMRDCGGELDQDTVLTVGGQNCFSSMRVNSNRELNVPANFGPIYINGGGARLQGDFSCTGCTIVLTNKTAASPIGTFDANAGAKINITPPLSGTFQGLAFYQDRRAVDCNSCNKINGHSGSVIVGAVYFPSQEIQYNGTGTTSATCTMFVGRRVNFTGNSSVTNKFNKLADCAAFGLPSSATTRIVRLVG